MPPSSAGASAAGAHVARALGTPWRAVTVFLLPAATFYVAFTAYPVFRTLWNSFHKVLPAKEEFVGLANYAELVRDEIFWRAVRNTLVWACTSPLFEVSIALVLALALYAQVMVLRTARQKISSCASVV